MSDQSNEFEKASQAKEGNIVSEFVSFMKANRKFWMLPLIIVLLALGLLVILSSTAAAPFIYTLF